MYEPKDVRDMCEGTQEEDMENWQRFFISDQLHNSIIV